MAATVEHPTDPIASTPVVETEPVTPPPADEEEAPIAAPSTEATPEAAAAQGAATPEMPKTIAELLAQLRVLTSSFMANPLQTSFDQTILLIKGVLSDPVMKRIYGLFVLLALKASQYPKPLLSIDAAGASLLPGLEEIESEPAKVVEVLQYLQTTFKDPANLVKVQKNMSDALQQMADKAATLPIVKALLDFFPFYSSLVINMTKSSMKNLLLAFNYPASVTPLVPADFESPTLDELVDNPQLLGKLFQAIASRMSETVQNVRPALGLIVEQLSKITASDVASMTAVQIEQFLTRINYPESVESALSSLGSQTILKNVSLPTREEILAQPSKLVELLGKLKEIQAPTLPDAPVNALRNFLLDLLPVERLETLSQTGATAVDGVLTRFNYPAGLQTFMPPGVVLPSKDTLVKQPENLAKMLLLLRNALEKAAEAETEAANTQEATAEMDAHSEGKEGGLSTEGEAEETKC